VLDRLDHCQEFLPGGTAILLSGGESLAVVSNDHLLTILDLPQYCTHNVIACIRIQDVLLSRIAVCQDRRPHQATFEAVECMLLSMGLLPVDPLCGESI